MKKQLDKVTHPPLNIVLWTIASLLIAATPHLLAMPTQLAITIAAVLVWRGSAAFFKWRPIPGWIRVIVTLGLLGLVAVSFGGLWGRRAATALLCVMLAAKMMEMYRVRDMRLVASVSFFLIATQFLFNESLIYIFYLALGCWTSTVALSRIQQIRSQSSQLIDVGTEKPGLIADATRLLLLGLPLALALFLLFPRLAQPLWGLPDEALDGKTGLSETMSPGSIANLYADDSPAFRVEFASGTPPPSEQLYWRGPVLWRFDGSTWSKAMFSLARTRDPVPTDENSILYEVQLEPHERRWLLALDTPERTDHERYFLTIDYQLVSRNPVTTLTAYNAVSNPNFVDSPILGTPQRAMGLQLPDDRNPRTLAMAQEWRERYPDDLQLANALLQWFTNESFFYSLQAQPLGRHSADEFLFDLRTGYCEYYASAFAIFMRAAGVPTRIVTGYQGGFWNSAGQYLLVRQSDAHAWNEIWLEGRGWVRVDPTAAVSPQRIMDGASDALNDSRFFLDWPLVSNLRNRLDRLQHAWNQVVLGFDAEAQVAFLQRLGLPELRPTQIALLMIAVLLLIGIPIALLLLRDARQITRDPAQKHWIKLQRRVNRRVGIKSRPSETPREWVARVSPRLANAEYELRALLDQYHQLHYGQPTSQSAEQDLEVFINRSRAYRPERIPEPEATSSAPVLETS